MYYVVYQENKEMNKYFKCRFKQLKLVEELYCISLLSLFFDFFNDNEIYLKFVILWLFFIGLYDFLYKLK